MGGRSAKAADFLRSVGFKKVMNLKGGILDWIDKVDPSAAQILNLGLVGIGLGFDRLSDPRNNMLRLSKKADYALIAMKHLALRGDAGPGRRAPARLPEQYDIPIELMAKVLQRLVRGGLLVSHAGHARRLSAGARAGA